MHPIQLYTTMYTILLGTVFKDSPVGDPLPAVLIVVRTLKKKSAIETTAIYENITYHTQRTRPRI